MADTLAPPILHEEEEDKILKIYNEISSIKNLLTDFVKSQKGIIKETEKEFSIRTFDNLIDKFSKTTQELARGIKNIGTTIGESQKGIIKEIDKKEIEQQNKEQQTFFNNLVDKFSKTTQELVGGIKNIGTTMGESMFNMLIGPFQLITKPLEELGNFNLFKTITGFFKIKKVTGKPTRAKMLKIDPGAVYIGDQLQKSEEKKKKSLFESIFGGLFKNFNPLGLLFTILKWTGLIGIFAGLTLTDLLGEGGAIEFFKKGEFGKGILTALFGKDQSQKGTLGKVLGIGKQALKWGALGAMIGSIVPGLGTVLGGIIGMGFGALGGAVKLGIDSGFFKKIWKQVNTESTTLNKVAKIIIKGAKYGAIGALLGSIIPGAGTVTGALLGFGLGIVSGGVKLGIDSGFFKKIWASIKKLSSQVGRWFIKQVWIPIKDIFNNLVKIIKDTIIDPIWNGLSNFFKPIADWINDKIIVPLKNFWDSMSEGISKGWESTTSFIGNIGTWINDKIVQPVKDFFIKVYHGTVGVVGGFIKGIVKFVDDKIIAPIRGLFEKIRIKIKEFFDNPLGFIQRLFDGVVNAVSRFFGKIMGFFKFIGEMGIFQTAKLVITGKFKEELNNYYNKTLPQQETVQPKNVLAQDKEIRTTTVTLDSNSIETAKLIAEIFEKSFNRLLQNMTELMKPVNNTVIEKTPTVSVRAIDTKLNNSRRF